MTVTKPNRKAHRTSCRWGQNGQLKNGYRPFPAGESVEKDKANECVIKAFIAQGLGEADAAPATILVLDTPLLRTTRALLARAGHGIGRIVIVEIDPPTAARTRRAAARAGLADTVKVVNADAFKQLAAVANGDAPPQIDYIWLDLLSKSPHVDAALATQLARLETRCLAVTFSGRGGAGQTVAARVRRAAAAVAGVLPHKLYDYGYSHSKGSQLMQLIVFGRRWQECEYHPREVFEIPGDPAHVLIRWYGYPNEALTLEDGPLEKWITPEES